MLNRKAKFKFLIDSLFQKLRFTKRNCPHCGEKRGKLVDRKYFLVDLVRCQSCKIMYRFPVSKTEKVAEFYQDRYQSGATTNLPDSNELDSLIDSHFDTIGKNYQMRIQILQALGIPPEASILEYGCSWGYGVKQFEQAGFKAKGFELSKPRALYAKGKLGVDVSYIQTYQKNEFDVVFCSHVLEHVPNVLEILRSFVKWLKPGGMMVLITPNGSTARKGKNLTSWHKSWGAVHPSLIDDKFYKTYFKNNGYLITSELTNLDVFSEWTINRSDKTIGDLSKYELLCAVQKHDE